ncbi:hypothetical protein BH18ACT15_BH18ACT15_13600 [soil metagenome]
MKREERPLTTARKLALGGHVWWVHLLVRVRLRRESLPALVRRLDVRDGERGEIDDPARLSRIVDKSLSVFGLRPRCLVLALVLFRLMRERGIPAKVVIGIPHHAEDHLAHAWVEVDGVDFGPPPGKGRHEELVRYP